MSSLFRQKLSNVIDHLYRYEYHLAISAVDTILSKDKKQKSTLTPHNTLTLHIIKAYCQVKFLRYGQAHSLFHSLLSLLSQHPSLEDELKFLELPSQVLNLQNPYCE